MEEREERRSKFCGESFVFRIGDPPEAAHVSASFGAVQSGLLRCRGVTLPRNRVLQGHSCLFRKHSCGCGWNESTHFMLGVLRNLGCCSKVGEDARHHWCQYNPIWWFSVLCSMLCLLPGLWFHTCFGQGGWRAMTMTTTHSGMSESDMTPRKKCYNSCVLLSWPGLHVHTVDDSVQHNEHERNTKGLVKTTMVHTSSTSIRFCASHGWWNGDFPE